MFSSTQDAEHIQWIDRGWYLITEFERTPSIHFSRAVELAQTYPEFTPLIDERNVMIYRNIYRQEDVLLFQDMLQLIKNWKGAKLYIKGERVAFDMLGSGIGCYCKSVQSHNPPSLKDCRRFSEETGRGCLACRRSYVSMEWNDGEAQKIPYWFSFGRLDEHQVYRIDKENLESAVVGELIEYHYCPLIDLEKVRAFIRNLPDRIDPRKDREWRYRGRNTMQENSSEAPVHFAPGAARQPAVVPIADEAYRQYLSRCQTG